MAAIEKRRGIPRKEYKMNEQELRDLLKENRTFVPSEERNKRIEYRRAGRSGLVLSAVSLGMWHNFGSVDNYENMRNMVFTAFDNGVTVYDLANNYGPMVGSAERNFGSILLRDLASHRDELIVATKAGFPAWKGPCGTGGGLKYLTASLDRSLKNLGLEYVDVFYHHRPDPDTPLEETCYAMKRLCDSGKTLYIGVSNYGGARTAKICALFKQMQVPFVLDQVSYSIFDRTCEADGTLALAKEQGFAVTAYSPLAQGLLSGRYLGGVPEDSRMQKDKYLREKFNEDTLAKMRALAAVAEERGQTLAEMALSWVLRDPVVASVIIGASRSSQIRENLKLDPVFTAEELARIDAIAPAEAKQ